MFKLIIFVLYCLINILTITADDPVTYQYDPDALKGRKPDYPIHPLILSRVSPRQMTGKPISDAELFPLFEAARWAPSGLNIQPWRFVYAKRNTTRYAEFYNVMDPINQLWAINASAIVIQLTPLYELYHDKPVKIESNVFDSGSAYLSMELEASGRGLVAHAIGGFDHGKAYQVLNVTERSHLIPLLIVVGKRFDYEHRLHEPVQQRRHITEFVFDQKFVNTDPVGEF